MSQVLDYAGSEAKRYSPGVGYWLILIANVGSLAAILLALPTIAGWGSYAGSGIIGDAYGPLLGIMLGIPYTLGQLFLGTFPAIMYYSRFFRTAKPRMILPPLVISIANLLACGGLTAACILAPHTHGSSC